MNLLCEFMDVKKLDMRVEKSGDAYTLTVTAEVDKIYDIGKISQYVVRHVAHRLHSRYAAVRAR